VCMFILLFPPPLPLSVPLSLLPLWSPPPPRAAGAPHPPTPGGREEISGRCRKRAAAMAAAVTESGQRRWQLPLHEAAGR
jgi:hypothetical protein